MPIQKLSIDALGPQGDGIHFGLQGKIFIEGGIPGDLIKADIFRTADGVFRGRMLEVVEPSSARVKAPCDHARHCGNCTFQNISLTAYQNWKETMVREALMRQGLRPREWKSPCFVPEHDRRRATFALFKNRGAVTVGYFRRRSDRVVPITQCLVCEPSLLSVRDDLTATIGRFLVEGARADLFIQRVGTGFDVVLTGRFPEAELKRALRMKSLRPDLRVSLREDFEDRARVLVGPSQLWERMGEISVAVSPGAFRQASQSGEGALVQTLLGALPKEGRFADLFSGLGTFTGHLLARGPVDAFEFDRGAVVSLGKVKNPRLRVQRRDLFSRPLRGPELRRYQVVVMDPPRAGAMEQARELANSQVPTVISISCNPLTFSRDAKVLVSGGYWLQSVRVVDQFRWSHQVEVIGIFNRRKDGRA